MTFRKFEQPSFSQEENVHEKSIYKEEAVCKQEIEPVSMRPLGWVLIHLTGVLIRRENLDTQRDTSDAPAQGKTM